MTKKLAILVLFILGTGLLGFFAGHRIAAAFGGQTIAGDPVRDLKARVSKLETQVAALQAQIKDLSSKSASRILTIPQPHGLQEDKMPPGAREFEFNGMKYWTIPLKDGK